MVMPLMLAPYTWLVQHPHSPSVIKTLPASPKPIMVRAGASALPTKCVEVSSSQPLRSTPPPLLPFNTRLQ